MDVVKDTCFSSLDERLLATWYPSLVLSQLPFRKSGSRIITLDIVTYARQMQLLTSFDAASEVHTTLREMHLQRRLKALLEFGAMRRARHAALRVTSAALDLGEFELAHGEPELSGRTMRDIAVDEVQRVHPYLEGTLSSGKDGTVLKIDHTFKVANAAKDADGTKPFTSIFTVLNGVRVARNSYLVQVLLL